MRILEAPAFRSNGITSRSRFRLNNAARLSRKLENSRDQPLKILEADAQ